MVFQSAPRSGERGDRTEGEGAALKYCFNPRPARVSGATYLGGRVGKAIVFQSAPRSGERGDREIGSDGELHLVSIRAPLG